jgi:hypothetical protein
MTAQEGGRFDEDGSAHQPAWTQQQRGQPKEQSVEGAQIRGPSPSATRDQKLMFQQKVLSHEGFGSSRPEKCAQAPRQLK